MDEQGPQRWFGTYHRAFEVSCFVPDGISQQWWINPRSMTGHEALVPDKRGELRARVTVHGRLSPPGNYGHLGGYRHELTVERIERAVRVPDPPAPAGAALWPTGESAAQRPDPARPEDVHLARLTDLLQGTDGPHVMELPGGPHRAEPVLLAWAALDQAFTLLQVEGAAARTPPDFVAAVNEQLRPPGRPPYDVATLFHALVELSWRPHGPVVLLVTGADALLADAEDEQLRMLCQMLDRAGRRWADPRPDQRPRPFHTVLQTGGRGGGRLSARLHRTGAAAPRIHPGRVGEDPTPHLQRRLAELDAQREAVQRALLAQAAPAPSEVELVVAVDGPDLDQIAEGVQRALGVTLYAQHSPMSGPYHVDVDLQATIQRFRETGDMPEHGPRSVVHLELNDPEPGYLAATAAGRGRGVLRLTVAGQRVEEVMRRLTEEGLRPDRIS